MENSNIKDIIKKININPFAADMLSQIELESIITYATDKYFNTNKPVFEDVIYDILVDFLKKKFPKSSVLKNIGSKLKSRDKVKLDYWLGSMDKIKPGTCDLDKWLDNYKDNYILSDKLDGISALLVYRTNGIINMYTRGTASEGLDLTILLKYFNLPSLDTIINSKYKANNKNILMAFRGELILEKKVFNERWSSIMKNGRNTVAGLVNSKNINPQLANDTKFVVYEIVDPLFLPEDQLKISKKLGFDVVNYKIVSSINYEYLSEYLKKRRNESEYIIDGIIVTNNALYERNIKSNPKYAFAFKDVLEEQITDATIIDIEWNVSKDGLIKPVLILNPVNICGVTITRVSGHNAKNIVDNKLGIGATIKLIRSGDVIPYIKEVIKPAKTIKMPDIEWCWNSTNVDIVSKKLDSKEILIKNIYHFFSSLDTNGLGEQNIKKLVNYGFDSVLKILKSTEKDFIKVEGFKEKSSLNLVKSIKKATKNVKLYNLMSASNKLGTGIGKEKIKIILDKYPNLLIDYKKWSNNEFINKLKELNNWEEKTSSLFVNNFNQFMNFYNEIKDYVKIEEIENTEKKILKNIYSNKNIVISGFRDAELKLFLENSGAKITNTINKNTDLLIVKDENTIALSTSKVKKALDLGIEIITKKKIKISKL